MACLEIDKKVLAFYRLLFKYATCVLAARRTLRRSYHLRTSAIRIIVVGI
ncbi:MAG: hypothetical protein V8R80_04115 [Eubacterium sp.]